MRVPLKIIPVFSIFQRCLSFRAQTEYQKYFNNWFSRLIIFSFRYFLIPWVQCKVIRCSRSYYALSITEVAAFNLHAEYAVVICFGMRFFLESFQAETKITDSVPQVKYVGKRRSDCCSDCNHGRRTAP